MFEEVATRAPPVIVIAALLLVSATRHADAGCATDNECKADRICDAGVCTAPAAAASCAKDTDCAGEQLCENAVCVVSGTPVSAEPQPAPVPPQPIPTPARPAEPPVASFAAASSPTASRDGETPSEPPHDNGSEITIARRTYTDGALGIIPLDSSSFIGAVTTLSEDLGTPSKHGGLVWGAETCALHQPTEPGASIFGFGAFLGYRLLVSPQVAFVGRAGLQAYVLSVDDGEDLSGNLILGTDANLGWFLIGLEAWVGESTNFMFRIGINLKRANK